MRYIDFDSPELAEYPDVQKKAVEGSLEPGIIMIEDQLHSIWEIPYSRMLVEFERLGATRAKAS